jgi:hypothetical protein
MRSEVTLPNMGGGGLQGSAYYLHSHAQSDSRYHRSPINQSTLIRWEEFDVCNARRTKCTCVTAEGYVGRTVARLWASVVGTQWIFFDFFFSSVLEVSPPDPMHVPQQGRITILGMQFLIQLWIPCRNGVNFFFLLHDSVLILGLPPQCRHHSGAAVRGREHNMWSRLEDW